MSFEAFQARARRGHLVPVWRECVLDTETPVAAFTKLKRGPFSFLLESAPAGSETWSRYTFMGTEPRSAWRMSDGRVEDWTPDAGWHGARTPADPLDDLEAAPTGVSARGRARVGRILERGRGLLRLRRGAVHRAAPPRAAAHARRARRAVRIHQCAGRRGQPPLAGALRGLGAGARRRARMPSCERSTTAQTPTLPTRCSACARPAPCRRWNWTNRRRRPSGRSNYEKTKYLRDVQRIKEYIVAGDAFQVLLARRIVIPHDFSSRPCSTARCAWSTRRRTCTTST